MWVRHLFLDTEVDGSASVCRVLEQDTLPALLQSTQLANQYQLTKHPHEGCLVSAKSSPGEIPLKIQGIFY